MRPHSRNLNRLFLAKGIAIAALVLSANAIAAEGQTATPAEPARQSLLAPEPLPSFGDVAVSPILTVFNAPHPAAVEAFDPAARFD